MALKYQSNLETRPDQPCPCRDSFAPREMVAFRFLKNNPANASDFVPPAAMNPSQRDTCGSYALSFFDTEENAFKRFKKLNKKVDARAKYGEFVGKLKLSESDGLLSAPSRDGHLDLHQHENVDFASRVENVKSIPRPSDESA